MLLGIIISVFVGFLLMCIGIGKSGHRSNQKVSAKFTNMNTGRTVAVGHGHSIGSAMIDSFYKISSNITENSAIDTIESRLKAMKELLNNNRNILSASDIISCESYISKLENLLQRKKNRAVMDSFYKLSNSITEKSGIDTIESKLKAMKRLLSNNQHKLSSSDISICQSYINNHESLLRSKKENTVKIPEHRRFIAQQRRLMSDSLRYDVMRRDGFRCQLCGATAQNGIILHVDHIIPVSKGGKTEMSNLRTLCERCNLGKSDKIE